MADFDDEQRARLDDVTEFVLQLAEGNFAARRDVSPRRDELDAVIAGLNLVAEDFGVEHERRQAAEEALRDTIEAWESAPAMFCSVDTTTGQVVQCNRTMERTLGRPRDAIIGQPLEALYRPTSQHLVRASLAALATGSSLPVLDHELVAAGGKTIVTLLSGAVVRDEGGAPRRYRLIYRDVGEERRLETQLMHAQKMEGIGRLAGGIAHDLNNLLSAIFGSAEMLRTEVVTSEGVEDLEQIIGAARRAAELTSQLLAFSRRTVVSPRSLNVNERLVEMDKLLRRTLGESIAIVSRTEPSPWTVVIDPGRFEQVIMNLAINARDAMPGGGKLTLETQNVVLDDDYVRAHHGVSAGDYVMVGVSDDGAGMSREVQDRLFEPFFTTKEVGKGTGLGLATAWGIVRQAGGTIDAYSEPGSGSTFKIYLPRAESASEATSTEPVPEVRGGSETVLVVEDDALVRGLVLRTLRRAGYEAIDGLDALELMRARDQPVDLTITDVVMPRFGGRELAEKLQADALTRAVLFVSGYTMNSIALHGVLEPGRTILQKPFTQAGLLQAVRSLLDGQS